MATTAEIIAQQRATLTQQQQQAAAARQQALRQTQQQLRAGTTQLRTTQKATPQQLLKARAGRQAVRTGIESKQRGISQQGVSFEKEVARKAPYEALPEYLEPVYKESLAKIQAKVKQLQETVKKKKTKFG